MFTLSGLILEARENLFRDFWSPFSISFYFSSERNYLKKTRNRLWAVLGQDTAGRGLYKSRLGPEPAHQPPPPIRQSRALPEVHRTSKSMSFKKNPFVVFLFRRIFPWLFSDRDFWSDFRFSFSFRSFIGIRQFKRLEFRLETLYLNNQLKQVFATLNFT